MELYHAGYVVEDLEKAMDSYTRAMGLTWSAVTPRPLHVMVDFDGQAREIELLATYSRQGPPYVELIQEVNGNVWREGGLDHLGFWVENLAETTERLRAEGHDRAVQNLDPTGCPVRFSYLRAGFGGGPWIELVDVSAKPQLMQWVNGGSYDVS